MSKRKTTSPITFIVLGIGVLVCTIFGIVLIIGMSVGRYQTPEMEGKARAMILEAAFADDGVLASVGEGAAPDFFSTSHSPDYDPQLGGLHARLDSVVRLTGPKGECYYIGELAGSDGGWQFVNKGMLGTDENAEWASRYMWVFERQAGEYYRDGQFEKAIEYYAISFDAGYSKENSAYNASCSAALLGDAPRAADWLIKAADAGWQDIRWAERDRDFALVRNDAAFQEAMNYLRRKWGLPEKPITTASDDTATSGTPTTAPPGVASAGVPSK